MPAIPPRKGMPSPRLDEVSSANAFWSSFATLLCLTLLCFMHLCPAGPSAELDRYVGYWKPYATSHADLDADTALQEEVRNAPRAPC
jgi:hypothetical protein